MSNKFRFVVIGAGTAGIICATYIKKYWGDRVDVDLIYDHSKPGIGVGESLTPAIYSYLDYVGITRDELVKNVNATVKLGLRFENWLNDGDHYYHNFVHYGQPDNFNLCAGFDIANGNYDNDMCYSRKFHDNFVIPEDSKATQALHIDAVLFSKYVENKFKDILNIIDDEVIDVVKKHDSGEIDHLILRDRGQYSGDFYIDATGFQRVLFKTLDTQWVDMTDWLPINKCIPNPLDYEFKEQPTYTISEASSDGWILQVPLSNRWGTGYLYSSEFTTDEQAFERFEAFIRKKYKTSLKNTSKVLKFDSGYWEEQWVGNCIAVGLASGFAEPLEATNIHHTVFQITEFVNMFNFKLYKLDIDTYNDRMQKFYKNAYLYLRFCYSTGRTDSDFWKYITHSTPEQVRDVVSKVKTDLLSVVTLPGVIFDYRNFTKVAYGLKLIDKNSYKEIIHSRQVLNMAQHLSQEVSNHTIQSLARSVSHKQYIDGILKS